MWNVLTWIIYIHGGKIWRKCLNICSGGAKRQLVATKSDEERERAAHSITLEWHCVEYCYWNIHHLFVYMLISQWLIIFLHEQSALYEENKLSVIRRFSQNCEKRLLALSCPSALPSVCMEQLGSHWTDFDEILYFRFFQKSVDKIQVSLKSDKNNGYFTWRRFRIYWQYLTKFFLERKMF